MFIELTDILRCPAAHDEAYLVLVPLEMDARRVVRGRLGCPSCHAEYPIEGGVADFGGAASTTAAGPEYDADALLAFMDLRGRGGYVCLVGRAARHADALAALTPGVHVVAVNPPPESLPSADVSLGRAARLPLKSRQVRAVVLGADHTEAPWLAEAVRVLLPGLRLVVESDTARPEGVAELGRGAGVLVGERRP